jgi:hypothetical protein
LLCGLCMSDALLKHAEKLLEIREDLVEALLLALPYIEDCLDSDHFKPGVVRKQVAQIRAALAKAGVK